MRVAYLVNQYPMVSLTFIRREIHALEAQGVHVDRFSIRRWHDTVVDPADQREHERTRYILGEGIFGLLFAALLALLGSPGRFFSAFALALRMARSSDRSLALNLAYFLEGCVLVRWLRQAGSQHLHAHFGTNPADVAMYCNALGGPPFSFTVHGPEEFDRADGLNYREKLHRAKFVSAISEFCRSQLYRWSAYRDWSKIQIVHCGLDAALIGAEPTPVPSSARLVSVGRLCEQKGQMYMLDAVAQLKSEGLAFELLLLGDGEMRAELEAQIARDDLSRHVTIAGWVKNDRVREEILAARAMVLPSFAEGLPVVIMEALALGRPVISTFIAGIPELVQTGATGWLVQASNVSDLADAMRAALAADPQELARLGTTGRALVVERHSADTEAGKLLALMRG